MAEKRNRTDPNPTVPNRRDTGDQARNADGDSPAAKTDDREPDQDPDDPESGVNRDE